MKTDGSYLYRVEFVYMSKSYSYEFYSDSIITPETDKYVAWGFVEEAIKQSLNNSQANRKEGIYPHSIVLYGEFGNFTIKE